MLPVLGSMSSSQLFCSQGPLPAILHSQHILFQSLLCCFWVLAFPKLVSVDSQNCFLFVHADNSDRSSACRADDVHLRALCWRLNDVGQNMLSS